MAEPWNGPSRTLRFVLGDQLNRRVASLADLDSDDVVLLVKVLGEATYDLPWFYWSGETRMNCLAHVVSQTRAHAYAHPSSA